DDVDDSDDRSVKLVGEATKLEYGVFLFIGVAMLWSWNMFMAAATYFQHRFESNLFIFNNFQSCILFVACATNFSSVVYFSSTSRQKSSDYPNRISSSLKINSLVFSLLALSTLWTSAGPQVYLAFTLLMVFGTSFASGMMQNGAFSWVNEFAPINTQSIMVGQAIAGVLPGFAQIVATVAVPLTEPNQADDQPAASPWSTFFSFSTAVFVSVVALLGLNILLRRIKFQKGTNDAYENAQRAPSEDGDEDSEDKSVPFMVLMHKLGFHAFSIFFSFTVTMIFPVYTQAILSVNADTSSSRFFQPDIFIPFSFMVWNTGDLAGRIICAYPAFTVYRPKRLALISVSRLIFIPLYMLCNIRGKGSYFNSDLVYWVIQLAFGFSNGWLGACNFMAAPLFVGEAEKGAAGGFMTMWLVGGLTAGSILSFFVM
ncbi:nucleoside transporter-domain-containing protein, partial [Peziza echinospora]